MIAGNVSSHGVASSGYKHDHSSAEQNFKTTPFFKYRKKKRSLKLICGLMSLPFSSSKFFIVFLSGCRLRVISFTQTSGCLGCASTT